jgi:tRNA pseudouridine38-40 synthase
MFNIAADGLLRFMGSYISGLVVEMGVGRRDSREMVHVLDSRDRGAAGPTAPPHGLYLVNVEYDPKAESGPLNF